MWNNPAHLAYIVVSPICSAVFALFNLVTIYVFIKRFRLATLSLIVIINICVCDIFVCLISNTFYVANILHPTFSWTTGHVCCKLFKFLTMLANISQIYLLCVLNADRLHRLVNARKPQWRAKQGLCFTAIAWIGSTLVCVPRLPLFDLKEIRNFSPTENKTLTVNYVCKPIGLSEDNKAGIIVFTFVVGFAVPTIYILYCLIRSQAFMWVRRRQIHMSTTQNSVLKMTNKLALTFNLTATLFLLVWTPFFVLSLVDLVHGTSSTEVYVNTNFSLRCTLLIVGSAKPIIYIVCLDKFRESFKCGIIEPSKYPDETSTKSRETHLQMKSSQFDIKSIEGRFSSSKA